MSNAGARWLGVGAEAGLAARCVGLLGWMAVACVPVSLASYTFYGFSGVGASVAAAGCCLAGAVPPLVFARLLPGHSNALWNLGFGMAFRMGIPLAVGLLAHAQGSAWTRSGFMLALVAYFWVGLIFDTLSMLSVIRGQSQTTARCG